MLNDDEIREGDSRNGSEENSSSYSESWRETPKAPEAPRYSYTDPVEEPKKHRGMSVGAVIALVLVCSLLSGLAGVFGARSFLRRSSAEPAAEVTPEPTATAQPAEEISKAQPVQTVPMSYADLYEANVNSTVGITTSITTNYWGYQSTSAASGSGFIYSADGYILTNYHVIEDSNSVTVTTYDNKVYDAEIVGYDMSNDVAVLKIEAEGLVPVKIGSSDALRVGDPVAVIGNPLGELTFSLSQGVVSALNREITISSGVTMDLIQTDAAINSGNSGGPLFNIYGEVIGITNAKYSSSTMSSSASIDNIGFAIPIDHVRGIVDSIIKNGYISKPYIGVSVATVSAEMQSYGLPQGAAVKQVNDDSPASRAGLLVNDIITAVNGEAIASSSDLVNTIGERTPGETVTLSVYHQDGSRQEITLVIGEQQISAKAQPEKEQQQQGYQGMFPFPFFGNFG